MFDARYILGFLLAMVLGAPPESSAADITWKVFVSNAVSPACTATTREGEEFVMPGITIPSGAQGIADALENARFLIPSASKPLEIHITLNIAGSDFEPIRQKPLFLNMTITVWSNGQPESSFQFPPGAPMIFTLGNDGLTSLLGRCHFSRSDDIVLAYDTGSAFSRDGIVTNPLTTSLTASISHLSTIVGSRTDLLGLSPSPQPSTWTQIKLLFQ
jgi:hypothetical protein